MFGATKFLIITCYKHPFMLVMRPCCDTKGLGRRAACQTTVHARVKGIGVGATPETGRLRHRRGALSSYNKSTTSGCSRWWPCAMKGEERNGGPGHIARVGWTSSLLPPVVQVWILPMPCRLATCENAVCVVRQGAPSPNGGHQFRLPAGCVACP